jgi:hypothetical protein
VTFSGVTGSLMMETSLSSIWRSVTIITHLASISPHAWFVFSRQGAPNGTIGSGAYSQ